MDKKLSFLLDLFFIKFEFWLELIFPNPLILCLNKMFFEGVVLFLLKILMSLLRLALRSFELVEDKN